MLIYIIMLIVSIYFAVYASQLKTYPMFATSYRIFAALSALPFILVTVLRYRVGTDWTYVYEPYLYYIKNGIEEFSEVGFTTIYRVFALFTDDAWYPIAFIGFITVLLFFGAIYQQSCMIPFSILLFVLINKYFTSLNQIRQMLAMSIFIYSLKHIYQKNWKGYFLWNLLGTSIHTSSLLYLPFYFLYGRKATVKRCVGIMVLNVILFPVAVIVLPKLLALTPYGWYLDSPYAQNNFYLLGFFVIFFATVLHVFCLYRNHEEDIKFHFMTYMMLASTILLLYSAVLPQILRVSEGLSVIQILSFPQMLKKEKEEKIWILLWLMIVGTYTVKLLYDVYVNKWYNAIPYRTIFSR